MTMLHWVGMSHHSNRGNTCCPQTCPAQQHMMHSALSMLFRQITAHRISTCLECSTKLRDLPMHLNRGKMHKGSIPNLPMVASLAVVNGPEVVSEIATLVQAGANPSRVFLVPMLKKAGRPLRRTIGTAACPSALVPCNVTNTLCRICAECHKTQQVHACMQADLVQMTLLCHEPAMPLHQPHRCLCLLCTHRANISFHNARTLCRRVQTVLVLAGLQSVSGSKALPAPCRASGRCGWTSLQLMLHRRYRKNSKTVFSLWLDSKATY